MVELEDDLVLVISGATGPNNVRSEVARKPVRRREEAGAPLPNLISASRLAAPRRYRRDGRVVASSGISILFELVQGRYSNGLHSTIYYISSLCGRPPDTGPKIWRYPKRG